MVGPVSSSSSNPLDRFFQECESIASGIPQLSNGRVSLQDKISAAYTSAIRDVEQEMESKGLSSSNDSNKVKIISDGSAKLALIDAAYKEALATIAGPKPAGVASSAPQSSTRDSFRTGFAKLSKGMYYLQELGSAFLRPPQVTILSSKEQHLGAIQNVFQKIIKGLEVPRLHPSESQAKETSSSASQISEEIQVQPKVSTSEAKAEGVESLEARISERDDFRKRFTELRARLHGLPETGPQLSKLPYYAYLFNQGRKLLEDIDLDSDFKEEFGPDIDLVMSGMEFIGQEIQFLIDVYTADADQLCDSCEEMFSLDPRRVNPLYRDRLKSQVTTIISEISNSLLNKELAKRIEKLESIKARL